MVNKQFAFIFLPILSVVIFISCSPQTNDYLTTINETQYSWTLNPLYTISPTYLIQTTITKEETIEVIATTIYNSTPTFTSTIYQTSTKTLSPTNLHIIAGGIGLLRAYANQEGLKSSSFDLDKGINDNSESSDIEYSIGCGSMCFESLVIKNGAFGYYYGMLEPGYRECLKHEKEFMLTWVYPPFTNSYTCIKTNQNNLSIIKIDKYILQHYDYSTIMEISFRTWKM